MIPAHSFSGKNVVVLGLGKSGLACIDSFLAAGARAYAWDDNYDQREKARARGAIITDISRVDWKMFAALVLSPGIPHTFPEPHPYVNIARSAGIPIICDIDVFGRENLPAKNVGITGTNGKSTTTAAINHIASLSWHAVQMGGNIGQAIMSLEPLGPEGIYVIEMSSFQLELTRSISLDVAVLLNISPDHLGRHGGMDGYTTAKKSIFQLQSSGQISVIGVDDPYCAEIYDGMRRGRPSQLIPISEGKIVPGGIYMHNGQLIDDYFSTTEVVFDSQTCREFSSLRNGQNLAATYASVKALGISKHVILEGCKSFAGLPHRQENLGKIDGVTYINDSKATNPASTARALEGFRKIFWIFGGKSKVPSMEEVYPFTENIVHAYAIGSSAEELSKSLEEHVKITQCGDLETAIAEARKDALSYGGQDPVIMLSPGCESFDQFDNFEHRGDTFRRLVNDLTGFHVKPAKSKQHRMVLEV
ncbi:MAG: UDP-N-acetylmuramoyl-L-alanine--D-glutamate ligase [Alphaproteobacteria bacterium]